MSYSKEQQAFTSSYNEEPVPPPYAEYDHTSAPAPVYEAAGPSSGFSVRHKFPQSLNGYLHQSLTKVTFHLGEKKDVPLFAGELHSGWSGKPEATLRDGPNEHDPVLATANCEKKWSAKDIVVMAGGGADPDEMTRVEMTAHHKLRGTNVIFAMDVGQGKDLRREEFMWRYSHGEEIRGLEGEKWGWKLVRLSEESGSGGAREVRAPGSTSDGKEVVAAWTHNSSWSMSKAFKFQFLGSGLTGVLGDTWAATALVSAVRMWWLESQSRTASAAAA